MSVITMYAMAMGIVRLYPSAHPMIQ